MSAQVLSITHVSAQRKTSIINRYAKLQLELSRIKTEIELLKCEAIEVLGAGAHETSNARVKIDWRERTVFDQAAAKSFLTAGQLAQCAKPSSFWDVRVTNLHTGE